MAPPILRTDGLTKRYGRTLALDHLGIEIEDGQAVGFLGPNGAGKTTTIRLLLDLIRPTSGTAHIAGFDCHRQSLRARRLIGYLPGEMPVYPELTAGGYLAYLGQLADVPPAPTTVERLLGRFGLGPAQLNKPVRDLSHGTKRKLGIVQALMGEPRLAILDEPTSGLDPLMIEAFAEVLNELKRAGRTTVFLSSHVLSEVGKTCDRVALVRDGRLLAVRSVADLVASLPRRVTLRFEMGSERVFRDLGFSDPSIEKPQQNAPGNAGTANRQGADSATSDPRPETRSDPTFRVVSRAGRDVVLELSGPLGPLLERVAGTGLVDVDVQAPSLEDYVLGLYRGDA